MDITQHPIDIVRHQEMLDKVKVSFLARYLNRFYLSLGRYLYQNGFLSEIADSDKLTGLYNRNFFNAWMPKIMAQANRNDIQLTFVYLDVNGLKIVNDKKGHREGDKILMVFAKNLLLTLRSSDMAFRMGGDEFAVVFWSCKKETATEKMVTLQEKLKSANIRFSFGVVEMRPKQRLNKIVSEADELMYEMKRKMKGI